MTVPPSDLAVGVDGKLRGGHEVFAEDTNRCELGTCKSKGPRLTLTLTRSLSSALTLYTLPA